MAPGSIGPTGPRPVTVPFLGAAEVERLLPMPVCIDAMADAFRCLARGGADQPLRTTIALPEGAGSLYVMPARLDRPATTGVKLLSIVPANEGTGQPSHQGVVVMFDPVHGQVVALLDAAAITAIRTAAVSALATRLMAREDATDLAMIGSGVQARSHLEAMMAVRPIRRVRVWSPDRGRREAWADWARGTHRVEISAAESAEQAVGGADLVCLVTSSPGPVVYGPWLRPGTHVNAVGAHTPATRELDTASIRNARLVVDLRSAALAEAGDLLIPIAEGAITADHIAAELRELVTGAVTGRESVDEITVFKSLGLAIEDVAAASAILERLGT